MPRKESRGALLRSQRNRNARRSTNGSVVVLLVRAHRDAWKIYGGAAMSQFGEDLQDLLDILTDCECSCGGSIRIIRGKPLDGCIHSIAFRVKKGLSDKIIVEGVSPEMRSKFIEAFKGIGGNEIKLSATEKREWRPADGN